MSYMIYIEMKMIDVASIAHSVKIGYISGRDLMEVGERSPH